jgi:hypothetical protein
MERGTQYPAWVYHRTLAPRVVTSAAEDDALGPDWSNTPATFAEPAAEPEEEEAIADAPKKRGRKSKA